ncbi:hypothetical protein EZV62_005137 [Acer yangbiense]|uniref:DUF4283 domain-containing protein n=1 Tax=Acer yangbiense TaxID=1000413 RepID=A0A5C7IP22_9ROSI|nr:hypothetical protein EZV62_005137 [Acer yangbiense]
MDSEEISRLCASLSIKGKDEKLWSVKGLLQEATGKKLELCLVGKILTRKHVNREAFRAVIPKIWQTNLDIEVVQDNVFLFYFRNQDDRLRVLAGGPWCFDNGLLVLERPSGVGNINSLAFTRVAFWIQIINAPLLCMTKEMGKFLGQLIGEVVDMDVGVTGECFGKYMRIRVIIDVSKPLKRFLRLELEKGEESMVLLRYEKLPEFCFHYGFIGHSYLECNLVSRDGKRDMGSDFDFGPWLRASNPLENWTDQPWRTTEGGMADNNLGAGYSQSVSRVESQLVGRVLRGGVENMVVNQACGDPVLSDEVVCKPVRVGEVETINGSLKSMECGLHASNMDMQLNEKSAGENFVFQSISESNKAELIGTGKNVSDADNSGCADHSGVEEARVENVIKKKGKWKRWAREGGRREAIPVGESLLDKRCASVISDTEDLVQKKSGGAHEEGL